MDQFGVDDIFSVEDDIVPFDRVDVLQQGNVNMGDTLKWDFVVCNARVWPINFALWPSGFNDALKKRHIQPVICHGLNKRRKRLSDVTKSCVRLASWDAALPVHRQWALGSPQQHHLAPDRARDLLPCQGRNDPSPWLYQKDNTKNPAMVAHRGVRVKANLGFRQGAGTQAIQYRALEVPSRPSRTGSTSVCLRRTRCW